MNCKKHPYSELRDESPLSDKEELLPENESLSRRAFLFSGAGLAIGTQSWSSLVDELTSLLDNKEAGIHPDRGESLPGDPLPGPEQTLPPVPALEKAKVFLTFDDGPLPCTGRILDLLASTRHKATFFVLGRNLKDPKLRDFAVRALREGHDIGNHSFSHPDFSRISAKRAEREIVTTCDLIREIVSESGVDPQRQNLFFRFPYGISGSWANYAATQKVLASLGYRIAWWDLDTRDWRMELAWFPTSTGKVLGTLRRARPRDVILLHDRQKTARCLPQIVDALDSRKLVSIPLSDYGGALAGSLTPQTPSHDPMSAETPRIQHAEGILGELLEHPPSGTPARYGLSGREPMTFFTSPLW
jgi:peptidoglycan-N-acetylglucosamine deacetylase